MTLQARYEPQEDRMRLTLLAGQAAAHVFLVTRRQWLGLLHALADVAAEGVTPSAPSPPRQRRVSPGAASPAPQCLRGIRLRPRADGVKLVFVTGSRQGVGVDVPAAGIARLRTMLQQQAERAGWDVAAALARLQAATLADAVVRKARTGGEDGD